MTLARLMGMTLLALTIVFVSLWFYARAAKRARLEAEWAKNKGPGRLESFVKAELDAYERPLRRKLIWGVYVIPCCLVTLLIYMTNTT